ncbi:hypothetical protein [Bacillus wiedmannii]|uniref:hypothetical protein n=1 Tax=Bacillus wiedmannii TaxID=1890302 RepID=UPI00159BBA9D|nr:hypothetical protein [Bacillus wiedmannii]
MVTYDLASIDQGATISTDSPPYVSYLPSADILRPTGVYVLPTARTILPIAHYLIHTRRHAYAIIQGVYIVVT